MQEQGLDPTGRVLLEPEGRNTAPAIAVAALSALASLNAVGGAAPDGEDVLLLVLPSDHVIGDAGVFAALWPGPPPARRKGAGDLRH